MDYVTVRYCKCSSLLSPTEAVVKFIFCLNAGSVVTVLAVKIGEMCPRTGLVGKGDLQRIWCRVLMVKLKLSLYMLR